MVLIFLNGLNEVGRFYLESIVLNMLNKMFIMHERCSWATIYSFEQFSYKLLFLNDLLGNSSLTSLVVDLQSH